MSEPLIRLLTLCLLALVYLFFLRVLRAVWVEVRAPKPKSKRTARLQPKSKPSPPPAPTPPPADRLVVIEPPTTQGHEYALGDEITLGRAAGCEVTVDDTYASQLHARVFRRDGQLLVEDLGSTNGTYLNRERVSGPTVLREGDRLQVGSTVFAVSSHAHEVQR